MVNCTCHQSILQCILAIYTRYSICAHTHMYKHTEQNINYLKIGNKHFAHFSCSVTKFLHNSIFVAFNKNMSTLIIINIIIDKCPTDWQGDHASLQPAISNSIYQLMCWYTSMPSQMVVKNLLSSSSVSPSTDLPIYHVFHFFTSHKVDKNDVVYFCLWLAVFVS